MSHIVNTTNHFEKALAKCIKRELDVSLLKTAVRILSENGKLPPAYRPHKLSGRYSGYWECHISSDWLLVWEQDDNRLTLLLITTETHSDIF
ncbi:MAG: type II toxin-antitoxin system YafQ family toxin [Bacteroides sp.]|nr:type II toxin-antitoxin system YafQ family toxin [Bacteroides sp.]